MDDATQKAALHIDQLDKLVTKIEQLPKPEAHAYFRAGASAGNILKQALKASAVGSETVHFGSSAEVAAHIIGAGAGMLGGIAETVVSVADMDKSYALHSHNNLAFASAAAHLSLSQVATGTGLFTLLAHTGAFGAISMSAVAPLAPFACASIAWAKAIRSIVELAHEVRKLHDNEYFKNDTQTKLNNVISKLCILHEVDEDALTDEKRNKLHVKIEKLTRQKHELNARWMLLSEPNLSEDKQKLYNVLMDNQRNKVYTKATSATSSVVLATGFTIIAASMLSGPAAPMLAGIGVAVVAAAAAIKLFELGFDKIIHRAVNKALGKECVDMNDEQKRQRINEKVCVIIGLNPENAEQMKMVADLPKKDAIKILISDYKDQLKEDVKLKATKFKSSFIGLFKSRNERTDLETPKGEVSFKTTK